MPDCKGCKKLRRKLKSMEQEVRSLVIVSDDYKAYIESQQKAISMWKNSAIDLLHLKSLYYKEIQFNRTIRGAIWNLLTCELW